MKLWVLSLMVCGLAFGCGERPVTDQPVPETTPPAVPESETGSGTETDAGAQEQPPMNEPAL